MKMQIEWSKQAIKDINNAAEYVALSNPTAANKMFVYIRNRIEMLIDQPYIGRAGRVTGTRELIIDLYPYIVPYRVKNNKIQILRVFHTSRKPPKNWQ